MDLVWPHKPDCLMCLFLCVGRELARLGFINDAQYLAGSIYHEVTVFSVAVYLIHYLIPRFFDIQMLDGNQDLYFVRRCVYLKCIE